MGTADEAFEEWLRHRVLGLLHAGRIEPGERLKSIRELARERGVDHRAVAEAYRALERDGFVEIRGSSGVYVADLDKSSGLSSERVRWVTGILHDGWKRGWSRGGVGRLVRRAGARKLRCACMESNEDHMVAFSSELASDFELSVSEVHVESKRGVDAIAERSLAAVDLVTTSVFHAELARRVAAKTEKPVILLTIDADYTARVAARLRSGPVTVVAVDPAYLRLARQHLRGTAHESQVVMLLADAERRGLDLEGPDVLLTRAARRKLGLKEFHLVDPPPGLISSESARTLLQEITRLSGV